ncbi:MAG: hypothetical protein [Microviridae sp.]|nr:MAG: hypothetical protein [Microviridae sp.]
MMHRQNKLKSLKYKFSKSVKGETLEAKIRRFMNNKEKMDGTAPLLYTERSEGVKAGYDPRADKWEVAADAMDKGVTGVHRSKREQRQGEKTYDTMTPEQQREFNTKFPTNKFAVAASAAGEGKA